MKGLVEQLEVDERLAGGRLGRIAAFDKEGIDTKQYWDDLSGKRLNSELVKRAREEGMSEYRKHGVYIKVPIQQCWDETDKDPIGARWVDINKGDNVHPEFRSRVVGQGVARIKKTTQQLRLN